MPSVPPSLQRTLASSRPKLTFPEDDIGESFSASLAITGATEVAWHRRAGGKHELRGAGAALGELSAEGDDAQSGSGLARCFDNGDPGLWCKDACISLDCCEPELTACPRSGDCAKVEATSCQLPRHGVDVGALLALDALARRLLATPPSAL